MKTKFGKYLENFMLKSNYTLEYISKETDASISIVGHYRKGIRIPKDEFIEKFIKKFISIDKEKNYIRYIVAYDRTPELIRKELDKKIDKIENNIIKLPFVGKAAAGRGYVNFSSENIGLNETVSYLIEVSGDSMFPTLCDGDNIVVNSEVKNLENIDGKICVLTYHDQTYVKRIKVKDKKIILKSDNKEKYKDIIIEEEQLEYLKLEGLVTSSIRKH